MSDFNQTLYIIVGAALFAQLMYGIYRLFLVIED